MRICPFFGERLVSVSGHSNLQRMCRKIKKKIMRHGNIQCINGKKILQTIAIVRNNELSFLHIYFSFNKLKEFELGS